jgi:DNA-binding XRE family transcriptional regulator
MVSADEVAQARRDLGRSLATLRTAAGYNQHTFAPLMAYHRSSIANVETGRQRLPREFWVQADGVLASGSALTDEYDHISPADRG